MKKRIWGILLALCMALSLLPAPALAAETGTEDRYTYLVENGEVTITACNDDTDEEYPIALTVPAQIAGYPVTAIGTQAFRYCDSFRSITIPDGVRTIGYGAFSMCRSLRELNLPNTLESISGQVIYGCSGLKTLTLPDSVTSLAAKAFADSFLESIRLSDGLKELPDSCFYRCSKLKDVTLPSGLKSIGEDCFCGCTSLSSFTVPDTVTSIGAQAFDRCERLKSVQFGAGLKNLPDYLFRGCKALTEVNFSSGLTELGEGVFSDCTSLITIELPDTIRSIGGSTFQGCTGLQDCTLPAALIKLPGATFSGCTALEEIELPRSITEIGNADFEHCARLAYIIVPDSVQKIGYGAFLGCSSMEWIFLPDSVLSMGESALNGCTSLTYVRIPAKMKSIPAVMFGFDEALQWVSIPKTVKSIDGSAFYECSALEGIEFGGTEPQLDAIQVDWTGNEILAEVTWYLLNGQYPDAIYGLYDLPAETNWAYPGIAFCLDNELMSGVGNGLFQPNGVASRAQLVSILWRLMGRPEAKGKTPFTDLKANWYQKAVAWAYENEIVSGTSGTTFSPDDEITREQLVSILYRMTSRYLDVDTSQSASLSKFPDRAKVSGWATGAVQWGVAVKLISGVSNGGVTELQPRGTATRAQIARIIMSYCQNVLDEALEPTEPQG